MIIIVNNRKRAQGELSSYLKPLWDAKKGETLSLNSGSDEFQEYSRLKKAEDKAKLAVRIVPQSFLISMVSQYDAFLVAAIKNLFLLKPEKIRTAEKTITVKDLAKFSSIKELLDELILDELDEVLRGSHLSQIQWVAKNFDFTLDVKDPLIEKFIEVTERRNLCVHNEGLVSKQYKFRTKELAEEIAPTKELGEHLPINRVYMQHARNTLFETAVRTIQIAWEEIRPDQGEEQDGLIITIIFELLVREDYTLARNISDFASSVRGIASEIKQVNRVSTGRKLISGAVKTKRQRKLSTKLIGVRPLLIFGSQRL